MSPELTVIDGSQAGSVFEVGDFQQGKSLTLSGFTITGDKADFIRFFRNQVLF